MSEAEFERLLDAVNAAMVPAPYEDFVSHLAPFAGSAAPANDNGPAWPMLPFPEGWQASC